MRSASLILNTVSRGLSLDIWESLSSMTKANIGKWGGVPLFCSRVLLSATCWKTQLSPSASAFSNDQAPGDKISACSVRTLNAPPRPDCLFGFSEQTNGVFQVTGYLWTRKASPRRARRGLGRLLRTWPSICVEAPTTRGACMRIKSASCRCCRVRCSSAYLHIFLLLAAEIKTDRCERTYFLVIVCVTARTQRSGSYSCKLGCHSCFLCILLLL